MEILYKGLAVQVEVTHCDAPVPARISGPSEDCCEAEEGSLEFDIVGIEIDCQETFTEALNGKIDLQNDEEFSQLVIDYLQDS